MRPRLSPDRHGRTPEQLISAIIPDAAPPSPPHPAPQAVLPAPPPLRPAEATSAPVIGTAQVDRSGRFQHGRIIADLRWSPGDQLLVDLVGVATDDTAAALMITSVAPRNLCLSHEQHRGQHPHRRTSRRRIDARGAITLPAAARSLCGIAAESTVVLVAEPAANRMFIRSAAVAVRLLVEHLDASPSVALDKRDGIDLRRRHER
jgi:bifunctional DNA-binding transcriptional regulator/antitoxin component of YhaV-PrlF toxin-antitoxin module